MIENVIEKLPEKLKRLVVYKSYKPGQIILKQDDCFRNVCWVKSGMLKAFHLTEKGQEFLVAVFGEKETLGEIEYFTGNKNFASVEALTDCELILIPENVFKVLIHLDAAFNEYVTTTICDRLSIISMRTIETNYYSLDFLVSKFLLNESVRLAGSSFVVSKKDIANYFATNIRSINRILKRYADMEIISIQNRTITINSFEKLKEIMINEQN